MITPAGPKVVEFNCRFGDPEAQAVLPLIESDLVSMFLGSARGNLEGVTLRTFDRTAVCVIIASGGYPDTFESGKPILGLENIAQADDVIVFHSATKRTKNALETSGGRVLGVTAVGPGNDLARTIDKAYAVVKSITFDGAYYRSDIGKKGIETT
jgi:phosphoribosylamine--glycine ligase